jgi:FRG domain
MNQSSSRKIDYESVDSIERLGAIHDELIAKYPEHIVLYRGQTRLYQKLQSGRRRPRTEVNADVEQGWSVVAGRIIGEDGRAQEQLHLRKAVLQHYGFVTDYLDLTSDIQIAAWFATNEFESQTTFWAGGPPRRFMQTRYGQRTEGTGYVIVIAVKREEPQKESPTLFNISNLRHLVRPQRQQAWLMLDRPPFLPDPNSCWVATIEINSKKVAPPFVTNDLFPTTKDDPGYQALLSFPFIQAQAPLLANDPTKGSAEALRFLTENRIPYFALRAIDAPEYVNQYGHGYYDHKWEDRSLSQPRCRIGLAGISRCRITTLRCKGTSALRPR